MHLNALYFELLVSGRADGRGGLSHKTVRYIHSIIHRALKDATRWNRLARNVAKAADPPALTQAPERQTWSASQLRQFLDSVRGDRLYAVWALAATTAVRRGEILGLPRPQPERAGRSVTIFLETVTPCVNVLDLRGH